MPHRDRKVADDAGVQGAHHGDPGISPLEVPARKAGSGGWVSRSWPGQIDVRLTLELLNGEILQGPG